MSKHVAVIGGGVIGVTTAWALVCRGQEVTLIEANPELGKEASFANGGQLSYHYVSPLADAGVPVKALGWMLQGAAAPLRFQPRLSPQQWRWCLEFLLACRRSVNLRNGEHLLRLSLFSQAVLAQWRETHGLDGFAWRRNGKLVIHRSAKVFERAAINVGVDGQRVLDAKDCLAMEPTLESLRGKIVGGIFSEDDEAGDCHKFCLQLEKRLLASGRYQRIQGLVSGFEQSGNAVKAVQLSRGQRLGADHFVLSAGNGSGALAAKLGIRLSLYPLRGYSLSLSLTNHGTVPSTSVTDFDHKVVYARLGDQFRVAAMVDVGARDATPDPARLAALRKLCQAIFPQAGDYATASVWGGLRPSTPQGLPVIGASPFKNFWMNVGHGSLGFTLSSGSAQIISDLILGQASPISLDGLGLPGSFS